MRYLVCKDCRNIYNYDLIHPDFKSSCPKADCGGDLVELDEEMLIPITSLWSKGYKTHYCCSGHIYESFPGSGYIMFDRKTFPGGCPTGWYVNDNCIRYRCPKDVSKFDIRLYIREMIDNLIIWIADLPDSQPTTAEEEDFNG